jgi:tRNA (cmo5U34)-methyltransferase
MLSIISQLATDLSPKIPKVLDIGSSYGDVIASILRIDPQSQVVLMDFSDEMIRLSRKRFHENQISKLSNTI